MPGVIPSCGLQAGCRTVVIPLGFFQRPFKARGPALLPLGLGVSAMGASAQLTTAHGHWDTCAEPARGMLASAVGFLRLC